jgi:acyl carrier protein
VVVGGEQLLGEQLQWWQAAAPEVRFINEYGPTETTVGSCVYEVEAGSVERGPVPIGRGIANTELYVLDAEQQAAGIGVKGELYIGGAGVGRGYVGRPELTAERFIPDEFSGRSGARLYRTGDQAFWRADGVLEYVGRLDGQVKVRGYRVELSEIESVLSGHEAVSAAVVVARTEAAGEQRLVGYVVAREPLEEAASRQLVVKLKEYLRERLPEYMVPSALLVLERLPLTASGKVARQELPAPETTGGRWGRGAYVAPQTAVEEVLAGIWSEVLKVADVGRDENFFALGGHSLLATQVVSRVQELFKLRISLRTMFETPTVAGLAASLLEDPASRTTIEKTAELLLQVSQLSDDDVDELLEQNVRYFTHSNE